MKAEKIAEPVVGRLVTVCCQCGKLLKSVPLQGSEAVLSHGYCEYCERVALEEFDLYMGHAIREDGSNRPKV